MALATALLIHRVSASASQAKPRRVKRFRSRCLAPSSDDQSALSLDLDTLERSETTTAPPPQPATTLEVTDTGSPPPPEAPPTDDSRDDSEPPAPSPLARLWGYYNSALIRGPLVTKSVTTGLLFGVADQLAQSSVDEKLPPKASALRTLRQMAVGGCISGPVNAVWYGFLARNIPYLVGRVFLDDIVKLPVMMSFMQGLSAVLGGLTPRDAAVRVRKNLRPSLAAAWAIWLPASTVIQSSLCPVVYRPLAVSSVAVLHEAASSFIAHGGLRDRGKKKH